MGQTSCRLTALQLSRWHGVGEKCEKSAHVTVYCTAKVGKKIARYLN